MGIEVNARGASVRVTKIEALGAKSRPHRAGNLITAGADDRLMNCR